LDVNPVSLVIGRDATWGSGALLPSDSFMYIGGVLNGPAYLADWIYNTPCYGCTDSAFDAAQQCYRQEVYTFSNQAVNTASDIVEYTGGELEIYCFDNTADRYYVSLDASDFNQARSYTLENCNDEAQMVISITGSSDVSFMGAPLPILGGGAVYIVPGARNIYATVGINGALIAPDCLLYQTGGVVKGKVVVASVQSVVQMNMPCGDQNANTPPPSNTPPASK